MVADSPKIIYFLSAVNIQSVGHFDQMFLLEEEIAKKISKGERVPEAVEPQLL
jgi:hypothetical protein